MRLRLVTFLTFTTLCALAAEAAGPTPALAYLDGGTGSMIFQWLIAGAVAGGFAIRVFWGRIASRFRRRSEEPEEL